MVHPERPEGPRGACPVTLHPLAPLQLPRLTLRCDGLPLSWQRTANAVAEASAQDAFNQLQIRSRQHHRSRSK